MGGPRGRALTTALSISFHHGIATILVRCTRLIIDESQQSPKHCRQSVLQSEYAVLIDKEKGFGDRWIEASVDSQSCDSSHTCGTILQGHVVRNNRYIELIDAYL